MQEVDHFNGMNPILHHSSFAINRCSYPDVSCATIQLQTLLHGVIVHSYEREKLREKRTCIRERETLKSSTENASPVDSHSSDIRTDANHISCQSAPSTIVASGHRTLVQRNKHSAGICSKMATVGATFCKLHCQGILDDDARIGPQRRRSRQIICGLVPVMGF